MRILLALSMLLAGAAQAIPTLELGNCEQECVAVHLTCELETQCAAAGFVLEYGPDLTVESVAIGRDLDPAQFARASINHPTDGRLVILIYSPLSPAPVFPPGAEIALACFTSPIDACHPITFERAPGAPGIGSNIGTMDSGEITTIAHVDGGVATASHKLLLPECTEGPVTQTPQEVSCAPIWLEGEGVVSMEFILNWAPGLELDHWEDGIGLDGHVVQVGADTDGRLHVVITPHPDLFPITTMRGEVIKACFVSSEGAYPGCTPLTFALGAEIGDNVGQPIPLAVQAGGLMIARMGDANGDGRCDGADYTIWADRFGEATAMGPSHGDFNGDGQVDGADYTSWADNFTGSE